MDCWTQIWICKWNTDNRLVTTVNEQLNIYCKTLIGTKINNLNNIIVNTTDFKLIMECQSENPVYIHIVNTNNFFFFKRQNYVAGMRGHPDEISICTCLHNITYTCT